MSFSDTVDTYNAVAASEALERKQRLALRQLEIAEVRKLGYCVQEKNGGLHVRLRWLDYYPSTGTWINPIKRRRGKLEDGEPLLDLVKREVGEPGPVLAKRAAERMRAGV